MSPAAKKPGFFLLPTFAGQLFTNGKSGAPAF